MRNLLILFSFLTLSQNVFGQLSWSTSNAGMVSGFVVNGFTVLQGKVYAVGSKSSVAQIYESSNNGSTWTAMTTTGLENYSTDYTAIGAVGNTLLIGGVDGVGNPAVFKSTDNGSSWTISNTGITGGYKVDAFAVTSSGLVVAIDAYASNVIYQSSDNGASWTQLTFASQSSVLSYSSICAQGDALYIGLQTTSSSYYKIYKSVNFGGSWLPYNSGLTAAFYVTCLVNSHSGLYADGYDYGTSDPSKLYNSIDDGATWTQVAMNGLSVYDYSFTQMCAVGNDLLLDANNASLQHMVFRTTVATGVQDVEEIELVVAPNPAKDLVCITMPETSQEYTVTVSDLIGNTVFQCMNTTLIDISALKTGTYVLKIVDGNKTGVTRIVKM